MSTDNFRDIGVQELTIINIIKNNDSYPHYCHKNTDKCGTVEFGFEKST